MANTVITRQDLMAKYQLELQDLEKEVSDEHLRDVSRIIDEHDIVGPELGLTEQEMNDINRDAPSQALRRQSMFRKWRQKCAWKTTYGKLINALLTCNRNDDARRVCELLHESKCSEHASTSAGESASSSLSIQDATYTDGTEHSNESEGTEKTISSPVSQATSIGYSQQSTNVGFQLEAVEECMNTEDAVSQPGIVEGGNRKGRGVYIVLCIDISPSMDMAPPDECDTHLETTIKIATRIMRQKMFEVKNIFVGLVLFGTSGTKNGLADKEGGYQHITVSCKLSSLSQEFFHHLITETHPGGITGNFLEAVEVAVYELTRANKKVAEKKIYLFTDAGSECSDSGLDRICASLKKKKIILEVVYPDVNTNGREGGTCTGDGGEGGNAGGGGNKDGGDTCTEKTPQQMAGWPVLAKMVKKVDGTLLSFRKALWITAFICKKAKKQTSRLAYISIGPELKIYCKIFIKTQVDHPPKWSKPSDSASKPRYHLRQKNETKVISADVSTGHCEREGLVTVPTADCNEHSTKAAGEQATTSSDAKTMKTPDKQAGKTSNDEDLKTYQCVNVLGFFPQDCVCQHQIVGDSVKVVVSSPKDKAKNRVQNAKALSALIHAMDETGSVGVARYVVKQGTDPKLVALFPQITTIHECLLMLQLYVPHERNVRYTLESHLEPGNNAAPSEEQLAAVDDLITSMDLMMADINDDGEKAEALKPNLTHHPVTQRIFQCSFHRFLHPIDPLPDMDTNLSQLLQPNVFVADRSSKALAKVQKLFPLVEEIDAKGQTAAPVRRKISELDLDSDAPPVKKLHVEKEVDTPLATKVGRDD